MFPSAKALGGHMRSHPEREWRGINPPAGSDSPPPDDAPPPPSDDNPAPPSIPNWICRDRRGRVDLEILQAAKTLFMMSRACLIPNSPRFNLSHLKNRVIAATPDEDPCPKGKLIAAGITHCEGDETKKENKDKTKKKKDTKTVKDAQDCSSANRSDDLPYRCMDCDKSFSTFQGLGGHRSTHNGSHCSIKKTSDDKQMRTINNSNHLIASTANTCPILANNQKEKENQIPVNHNQKEKENQILVNHQNLNLPTKLHKNLPSDLENRDRIESPDTEATTVLGLRCQTHDVLGIDLNVPCPEFGNNN